MYYWKFVLTFRVPKMFARIASLLNGNAMTVGYCSTLVIGSAIVAREVPDPGFDTAFACLVAGVYLTIPITYFPVATPVTLACVYGAYLLMKPKPNSSGKLFRGTRCEVCDKKTT